ncbi:MAG: CDP-alcohol phosphatidyltransferase family protein [Actinomycetota bacterium]
MNGSPAGGVTSRVLTIPNLLSFARVLLIPLFVWLIVREGSEAAGLLLFGMVSATDWVDGYVARKTGQVSELGKLLDPTADRLAIGAALIAMVVRDAFPLWAALLIIVRDGLILIAGVVLLATRGGRIDVRFIGKVATFSLMTGVPLVAWGSFELPQAAAATVLGWTLYAVGILEYYVATVLYIGDLRRAFAGGSVGSGNSRRGG